MFSQRFCCQTLLIHHLKVKILTGEKMKVKHTLLNNLQTQEYFQNKYVIYAYFFPPFAISTFKITL